MRHSLIQTAGAPSHLLHGFDDGSKSINKGSIVFHKKGKDVASGKPTKVTSKTTYSVVELEKHFKYYIEKLPEGYKFDKLTQGNKTNGLVFKQQGTNNEITFKMAKLDSDYLSQQRDYFSYTKNGNMHIARNGDMLYENKGNIVRKDFSTGDTTVLPKDEMLRLGIKDASYHSDVHIPIEELTDLIQKINGKR